MAPGVTLIVVVIFFVAGAGVVPLFVVGAAVPFFVVGAAVVPLIVVGAGVVALFVVGAATVPFFVVGAAVLVFFVVGAAVVALGRDEIYCVVGPFVVVADVWALELGTVEACLVVGRVVVLALLAKMVRKCHKNQAEKSKRSNKDKKTLLSFARTRCHDNG